jgi:hypothetical protein
VLSRRAFLAGLLAAPVVARHPTVDDGYDGDEVPFELMWQPDELLMRRAYRCGAGDIVHVRLPPRFKSVT